MQLSSLIYFYRGANLARWRCTIAAPVHENAAPEAYDLRGVVDAYFRARTCRGTDPHPPMAAKRGTLLASFPGSSPPRAN